MTPAVPAAVLGGAVLWLILSLRRRSLFQEAPTVARRAAIRLPVAWPSRWGSPAAAAAGVMLAGGAVLRNPLAGLLLAPLGWQAALALRERMQADARREADVQARAAVDVIAEQMAVTGSASRALAQAVEVVTGEVRDALEHALAAHALGRPVGQALEEAAGGRADLHTLARLLHLADERSAEAARGLGRLAEALREREVLRANRQAEAAGARLVALLLLVAPLGLLLAEAVLSPSAAAILTGNGLGRAAADWVAGSSALAAWWLRRAFEEEEVL